MSIGQIFLLALKYTLLGMGTVFAILILISICIWILGILTRNQREQVLPAAAPGQEGHTYEPAEEAEEYDGIQPEIVAAITAVIHQHMLNEMAVNEEFNGDYIIRNVRRAQWKHIS